MKGHGYGVGIYTAWNWGNWTGPEYAAWTDAELRRIGWQGNAAVCLDVETHDIAGYVIPCLQHWRQLRPTRQTDWTLEGMQGGLFSREQVGLVMKANVRLAPSFYGGNMQPLDHSVTLDLLMAGFPGYAIVGMYDAARLPYRWTGYAFTQGRLP